MTVEVGTKVSGKVSGITNFGAFIDLGDHQTGLVHISEVSNTYVKDIHDVLKVGDEVQVKVLKVGDDGKIFCDCGEFPLLVEYLEGPEQVFMTASVGTVPTQGRELFYQKLLQGQYLFHQTCGATLALDVELTFVTLQIVKDMQTLTVQNFPILVANFLRTAEYWHARCEEASDLPGTEKQGGTA